MARPRTLTGDEQNHRIETVEIQYDKTETLRRIVAIYSYGRKVTIEGAKLATIPAGSQRTWAEMATALRNRIDAESFDA